MTLPVALSGTDVIGQAKTGTGKTLGFGLPLLERVTVPADVEAGRARPEDLTDAPQALVVVPTRELCTQVTNDLLTAGKVRNVRVLAIYGGRAYEPQVEALKKGVDVVVGTPGRLLDLAGQKKLNLGHIKALVLDEADEMLDLGFLPDVEKIINLLPARRQTMLFSATMPGAVIGLARRYMSQPTHIRATAPDDEGKTVANTAQFVYRAHNMDKPEMVARILQSDGRGLAMVFCRTKRTAADLADQLKQRGFAAGAVHGDLGQGAREQALRAFRNGKVDVLVCTDVAARGIDVEGVTHVINYQSPEEEKTYLHRIGRTGRAGAKGIAITLVDWDDIPRWQLINKALELNFNDPPETYSTSPHFYEELNIPAGTKGILPRAERTRAGLDAEELEDLGEPGGRGARGRGDRDRGRGRGGRDESRSADRERSERTPRRRRRTRGGSALDTTAPAEAVAPSENSVSAPASSPEDGTATRTPRRRRRTRGGAADSAPVTASTAAVTAEPAVSEAAEAAVTTAESPSLDTEALAKPRRRRTRKSAEAPVEQAQAAVVETAPVAEVVAETPAAKPRRTRRSAAAAPAADAAEVAVDTAEATEAKPRRRTRKAAEPAVAAVAAVETVAAPKVTEAANVTEVAETKPRRTRKTAATKAAETAEAAVDTAEGTATTPRRRTRKTTAAAPAETATAEATETAAEAKPRRTRKTAATKAAEAAVDTVEATEAVVEAKPRRTRKTAATKAAEAAVDTVEATATAPRRRTRKAAEPAVAAEIPVQTVQEPEVAEAAKPRRTRKTAATKAAEAAADTAEGTATKPRRTRKTAAAAPAETATAEVAEAKPRRRTTRKAAEPAVTADIPAQADQEPAAPRRRTRKTAATEPADS
ncbi:DEAD/DEAH box helicase [Streptomyces griseorubiginosus]|uniref:DEAD/DEAH box helicase n=1 Tax=Streptomyces griseorubiginosus TaxID=67304 RepID=UPI00076CDF9C|nr:DEAD/DEAH box helicase [Streptomyces griseorubiginosus]KUM77797.1 DEAD/DEAH box helicase [Streptomyces griseorubiginosus]